MSADINTLRTKLFRFRDARDWNQFHSLKNLAAALSVEAAELLELTQWKTAQQLEGAKDDATAVARFSEEIADVFIYLLLISDKLGIDLLRAADKKLKENARRYPIKKSRGSAKKYSEL